MQCSFFGKLNTYLSKTEFFSKANYFSHLIKNIFFLLRYTMIAYEVLFYIKLPHRTVDAGGSWHDAYRKLRTF